MNMFVNLLALLLMYLAFGAQPESKPVVSNDSLLMMPIDSLQGRPAEKRIPEPNLSEEISQDSSWKTINTSCIASWYGPGFQGRKTANGERFNTYELTAAHKTLPFNTLVRVTNLENDMQVIVRINDRGPYVHGRAIDLSKAARDSINGGGLTKVKLEILDE